MHGSKEWLSFAYHGILTIYTVKVIAVALWRKTKIDHFYVVLKQDQRPALVH